MGNYVEKNYYAFTEFERTATLLQKRIAGKTWAMHGESSSKRKAQEYAKKIRGKGKNARVIYEKDTKQYIVYTPLKKGKSKPKKSKPKKRKRKSAKKKPWYAKVLDA